VNSSSAATLQSNKSEFGNLVARAFMLTIPLMIFVMVAFQMMSASPWSPSIGLTDTIFVPMSSATLTVDDGMTSASMPAVLRFSGGPR